MGTQMIRSMKPRWDNTLVFRCIFIHLGYGEGKGMHHEDSESWLDLMPPPHNEDSKEMGCRAGGVKLENQSLKAEGTKCTLIGVASW